MIIQFIKQIEDRKSRNEKVRRNFVMSYYQNIHSKELSNHYFANNNNSYNITMTKGEVLQIKNGEKYKKYEC